MRIIISGGGTGGHIFPALAVAEELKKRIPDVSILFIGARDRMEMRRIPEAGFQIEGLWISGLQRNLTYRNLLFPIKLVNSLWRSYRIIRRFKPDVAAGFGGYASAAAVYMASLMKIPTLVQEQNSYPGLTNRILSSRADRICVAYDSTLAFFPKGRTIMTGNPVRAFEGGLMNREEAKARLGFRIDLPLVVIMGGSLGARTFNEAMRSSAALLTDDPQVQFLWQTGGAHFESYRDSETAKLAHIRVESFFNDMSLVYRAADLMLTRAGALTLSEIMLLGKAAVLVPSPNVVDDHQTKNAMALVNQDAAVYISDQDLIKNGMLSVLTLARDREELRRMENNVSKLGIANATELITDEIIKLKK